MLDIRYIAYDKKGKPIFKTRQWQFWEEPPLINLTQVEMIQADGRELEAIENRFTNLTLPRGNKVVTWNDEMARFILRYLWEPWK